MVTLSNSIVIERIREETSLVILSELTDYISISFLRHLEREKPDNKYYKFSLLYKILEPIFCLPIPSYARTSQAKIVCKKITDNLSPKIVDFLDHPEDFGCFEVKSNWLITEIEKSLWQILFNLVCLMQIFFDFCISIKKVSLVSLSK